MTFTFWVLYMAEESRKELFIILDDREMTWFIVEASSEREAVKVARSRGFDPYYVVARRLVTEVWELERRRR